MALYSTLASLSQTAAANAADGATDAPSTIDQQTNLLASFIAQLRDSQGNYRNLRGISSAAVLDSTYYGAPIISFAGPYTITLPSAAVAPPSGAATICITNFSTSTQTIARAGSDQISMPDTSSPTTFSLKAGETISLASNGTNAWYVVGGSVATGKSASFKSSIAASGYQTFPSGLIMQWGQSSATTVGPPPQTTVTYPIAFPTAVLSIVLSDVGASVFKFSAVGVGLSNFTAACESVGGVARWIALGY